MPELEELQEEEEKQEEPLCRRRRMPGGALVLQELQDNQWRLRWLLLSRRRMRAAGTGWGRSVVRAGGQPTWTNLANRGCEPQELARSRTAAAATGRTCLTSRCSSSPVISLLLLPSSAVTSGLQEKKVLPTKIVRSQEVQEEASPARCSSPCRRDGRGLCLTRCPPTTQSQVRRKQMKKRSRVTLVSPPRSEHGDDVSVLFQVLGLALPNPLGLVAERS